MKQDAIPEQEVRLHKVIAQAGVTSRRKAEALIVQGRVIVNGKKITTLGSTVDPTTDMVVVDGKPLRLQAPLRYVLLHKPRGYVTTCQDEQRRRTVFDLLKRQPVRLFPVGRLDMNSEGVLLLTNDGRLAHRLLHPSYGIPRTYLVRVDGVIADVASPGPGSTACRAELLAAYDVARGTPTADPPHAAALWGSWGQTAAASGDGPLDPGRLTSWCCAPVGSV